MSQQSPTVVAFSYDVLDRMEDAVARVRERLIRAVEALNSARLPYAVVGGNAVAAWVSRIDPGKARNTVDVDLLVRRDDLAEVIKALESAGFVYSFTYGVHLFVDGPNGRPSEGIHLLFAKEKVKSNDLIAAPDVEHVEPEEHWQVAPLESLVSMKLITYRRKDQVHLQDLIDVGLIDASWPARFPPPLDERLQALLDDPDG